MQHLTFDFTHAGTRYAVAVNPEAAQIESLSRFDGEAFRPTRPEHLSDEGYHALWAAADVAVIDAEKGPH